LEESRERLETMKREKEIGCDNTFF